MLKMKQEKLLPIFKHYMMHSQAETIGFIYNTPLECQVIATSPKFIISDGFHKVQCKITEEAIISMKQFYPSVLIKELDKLIITLIEYLPQTYLENKIHPILHIYDFYLSSPENQKKSGIAGKPKEIGSSQEVKREMAYETQKHLRRNLSEGYPVNKVPPLERILLTKGVKCDASRIIQYVQKTGNWADESGHLAYDVEDLESKEDTLTDQASKRLADFKDFNRKQKERARKVFKEHRDKPVSLGKELEKWVEKMNMKKGKMNAIKDHEYIEEGVAKIIRRGNKSAGPNLISVSKASMNKSINSKRDNTSEVKFSNARRFKDFMQWHTKVKGNTGGDNESNDVSSVLRRDGSENIKAKFATPKSRQMAFSSWHSTRRQISDGANSSRKSTAKKPKL